MLAESMTIIVVIGPHNLRSAGEGVIQLSTHIMKFIATVTQPVQAGQFGHLPVIESMDNIMKISNAMETAAIIRPLRGKAPSFVPPCVIRPQGAPNIRAI